MAGRRSKLTKEVNDRFIRAIKLGCPIKDACGCASIGETTYYKWIQWADSDRKDVKRYREFRDNVKAAEGEATQAWLAIIEKAAREGSWQAAAWKLERRRDMFIPRMRQEVTGKDGEAIRIEEQAREARDIITSAITRLAAPEQTEEGSGQPDPETTH
tara:strand:+ start:3808 stop:4281 length:474 start_codon:yes stop_codon:yes gene_type:complete